jgi:hypothetical protein
MTRKGTTLCHIIIKIPKPENKKKILKAAREKFQASCYKS